MSYQLRLSVKWFSRYAIFFQFLAAIYLKLQRRIQGVKHHPISQIILRMCFLTKTQICSKLQ